MAFEHSQKTLFAVLIFEHPETGTGKCVTTFFRGNAGWKAELVRALLLNYKNANFTTVPVLRGERHRHQHHHAFQHSVDDILRLYRRARLAKFE